MGQDLATATKKLEIARNVIVALKGDVASAREEVQSLHSALETARSDAQGAASDAQASIAALQDAVSALEAMGNPRVSLRLPPSKVSLKMPRPMPAAQKVANDATIAALTQEAQALKARNDAQGTRIKELKAELKERKAALKEGDATAETQAARIAQLEEDLDFTEALRADLVSQRNELARQCGEPPPRQRRAHR